MYVTVCPLPALPAILTITRTLRQDFVAFATPILHTKAEPLMDQERAISAALNLPHASNAVLTALDQAALNAQITSTSSLPLQTALMICA